MREAKLPKKKEEEKPSGGNEGRGLLLAAHPQSRDISFFYVGKGDLPKKRWGSFDLYSVGWAIFERKPLLFCRVRSLAFLVRKSCFTSHDLDQIEKGFTVMIQKSHQQLGSEGSFRTRRKRRGNDKVTQQQLLQRLVMGWEQQPRNWTLSNRPRIALAAHNLSPPETERARRRRRPEKDGVYIMGGETQDACLGRRRRKS